MAFHEEHVVAAGTTVAVAGDLAGIDVRALVEGHWAGWAKGPDRASSLSRVAALAEDRGGSSSSTAPAPCRPRSSSSARRDQTARWRVAGPHTPSSASCWVARPMRGSTPSCARRRATPTAFAPASVRGAGECSSPPVQCAPTARRSRSVFSSRSWTGSAGSRSRRSGPASTSSARRPGRYATADAVADEAINMALDGRSTEFTTANLRDLERVDAHRLDDAFERFAADGGAPNSPRAAAGRSSSSATREPIVGRSRTSASPP